MLSGHFLNLPSMESLKHLINCFGGALGLYIFKLAFGCGFWCAGSVVQNFFQLSEESQNGSWAGALGDFSNSWLCPLGEVFETK